MAQSKMYVVPGERDFTYYSLARSDDPPYTDSGKTSVATRTRLAVYTGTTYSWISAHCWRWQTRAGPHTNGGGANLLRGIAMLHSTDDEALSSALASCMVRISGKYACMQFDIVYA